MKELFFKHLVFTSNNLKKVLIFVLVNIVGISSVVGIPIIVIFDIAFFYYNLNRIFKGQGGIKFLLEISNFLWLIVAVILLIVFFK